MVTHISVDTKMCELSELFSGVLFPKAEGPQSNTVQIHMSRMAYSMRRVYLSHVDIIYCPTVLSHFILFIVPCILLYLSMLTWIHMLFEFAICALAGVPVSSSKRRANSFVATEFVCLCVYRANATIKRFNSQLFINKCEFLPLAFIIYA